MSNKQSKEFTGAGVLLYDYHPVTKELVFLLGREYRPNELIVGINASSSKFLQNDTRKNRHNTFSEFGGHADVGEDPGLTAIRELGEESMGMIEFPGVKNVPMESYRFRDFPISYYIFLARYSYSDEIVKNFNDAFEKAKKDNLVPVHPNGLYEKSELRWFTVPEIINEENNIRKPFYSNLLQIIKIRFSDSLFTKK